MRNQRHYTEEFKQDAVKLVVEDGYSQKEAAKNLGIPVTTLKGWMEKQQDAEKSEKEVSSEQRELKRMKEEIKRLTQEREILKKALAFFARENP